MRNPNDMMKQVKKMQAEMAKIQEELNQEKVEATAGGGMVTAVASGQQEMIDIKIAAEAVDPEDIEMLQDMIIAAVNEALRQSKELANQKLGRLTGGLSIPGLI